MTVRAPAARAASLAGLLLATCIDVRAQEPAPPDLANASIEQLMRIQITSAARKKQRVEDTPAAVFVVTSDDIRRSGIRSLPELFRLVPGVQVAQINSSNWAVSIRGFNGQFANKLLVLVDGRSSYKRSFSGVLWDGEDLVLDDIERIEVIRGPGGAVWGANAVNGVINIVTKAAADTQGLLVRAGAGTLNRAQGTIRYGGTAAGADYRVYSQWTARGQSTLADLTPADDSWSLLTSGARFDWTRGANTWTLDGSARTGELQPLWRYLETATPGEAVRSDKAGWVRNGAAVGRWTHQAASGGTLQVQSTVAVSRRFELIAQNENSFDSDLTYHTRVAARHDVVAGGGYRFVGASTSDSFTVGLTPSGSRTSIVNTFVQDEMRLPRQVWLTLGAKLEHDSVAGWHLLPTARAIWQPAPRQRLWAAVAQAVRTPASVDLAIRYRRSVLPGEGLPILIAALGNPEIRSEQLVQIEAGYRLELGAAVSVDATTFRGRYTDLRTAEPFAPVFEAVPAPAHPLVGARFANDLDADTVGFEVAARVSPLKAWRLDASYSGFRLTPHVDGRSHDAMAPHFDGDAPAHQWQVHSLLRPRARIELDAAVYRVGRLRQLGVPAYTRADVRAEIRLTPRLAVAAAGRNLFDRRHPEHADAGFPVVATLVPRSADVHLIWRVGR